MHQYWTVKMKRLSKIIFFVSAIALLGSCSLHTICNERFPCVPYDSIQIKDSLICCEHDTINMPYEEAFFDTSSPCPPQIAFHKEINNGGITGILDISDGKLRFSCKQDSLQRIINSLRHDHFVVRSSRQPPKEIKVVPWWYKMLAWSNLLWILIIVIIIGIYELARPRL